MANHPDRAWAVGAVANGHVLTAHAGWVRLNFEAMHEPWRPGDVIRMHAFTGAGWVPLPAGWRPDPTGRHHLRWWTGQMWSHHVSTNGRSVIDPIEQPAQQIGNTSVSTSGRSHTYPIGQPVRQFGNGPVSRFGSLVSLISFRDQAAWILYGGFWLIVAIYSVTIAWTEDDPRYLLLTSTASLNIFLFRLTGETRDEINRAGRRLVRKQFPYIFWAAFAAGGVWLSLHFDSQFILTTAVFIALVGALVSWVS